MRTWLQWDARNGQMQDREVAVPCSPRSGDAAMPRSSQLLTLYLPAFLRRTMFASVMDVTRS